jgi:hypothetical protein
MYHFLIIFSFFIPVISFAQTPKADHAIKAVKELCLVGTQYDLKADASGNLTLVKLVPGGRGAVSVNVRESSGAAAIFDDKLRVSADKEIRECIKPHIGRIINAILDDSSTPRGNSSNGSNSNQRKNITFPELQGTWIGMPRSDLVNSVKNSSLSGEWVALDDGQPEFKSVGSLFGWRGNYSYIFNSSDILTKILFEISVVWDREESEHKNASSATWQPKKVRDSGNKHIADRYCAESESRYFAKFIEFFGATTTPGTRRRSKIRVAR